MNSKKLIFLSGVASLILASPAMAQMRHGGSMGGAPMGRAPMAPSAGRAPMQRPPMVNSRPGFNRFNDRDFDRFDRDDRFRRVFIFNDFGFGFPFWGWGWGWGYPYYGYPYPYPYPYPYYGSGYGASGSYGYSSSYGGSASVVVEVQRRLASAGFYSGRIDGIPGSGTRSAIRAFERSRGLPVDGAISQRLLAAMGRG